MNLKDICYMVYFQMVLHMGQIDLHFMFVNDIIKCHNLVGVAAHDTCDNSW